MYGGGGGIEPIVFRVALGALNGGGGGGGGCHVIFVDLDCGGGPGGGGGWPGAGI